MNVGQMLLIAHSVSDKVHTVNHTTPVVDVAKKLDEKRIGALLVLKDGYLVGIISERDIATRLVAKGLDPKKTKASQIMTPNPTVAFPNYTLEKCHQMMERGHFRHMPVFENNRLIGMISIRDILVALIKQETDLRRNEEILREHFENYIYTNR